MKRIEIQQLYNNPAEFGGKIVPAGFLFDLPDELFQRLDLPCQPAGDLGQILGADNQKCHCQHEKNLHHAQIEHVRRPLSLWFAKCVVDNYTTQSAKSKADFIQLPLSDSAEQSVRSNSSIL